MILEALGSSGRVRAHGPAQYYKGYLCNSSAGFDVCSAKDNTDADPGMKFWLGLRVQAAPELLVESARFAVPVVSALVDLGVAEAQAGGVTRRLESLFILSQGLGCCTTLGTKVRSIADLDPWLDTSGNMQLTAVIQSMS